MKNHMGLSFLFMLFLGLALTGYFAYDFHSETRREVKELRNRLKDMERKIELGKHGLAEATGDATMQIALAKLQMEKVVIQLPYLIHFEMVDNGLFSFVLKLLTSQEKRRQELRQVMLSRCHQIDIKDCPEGFKKLFGKYASETGLDINSLVALREFAQNYSGE